MVEYPFVDAVLHQLAWEPVALEHLQSPLVDVHGGLVLGDGAVVCVTNGVALLE